MRSITVAVHVEVGVAIGDTTYGSKHVSCAIAGSFMMSRNWFNSGHIIDTHTCSRRTANIDIIGSERFLGIEGPVTTCIIVVTEIVAILVGFRKFTLYIIDMCTVVTALGILSMIVAIMMILLVLGTMLQRAIQ